MGFIGSTCTALPGCSFSNDSLYCRSQFSIRAVPQWRNSKLKTRFECGSSYCSIKHWKQT
jgi:hypothetical protein